MATPAKRPTVAWWKIVTDGRSSTKQHLVVGHSVACGRWTKAQMLAALLWRCPELPKCTRCTDTMFARMREDGGRW